MDVDKGPLLQLITAKTSEPTGEQANIEHMSDTFKSKSKGKEKAREPF